jgi:hypothetical protein
VANAFALLGLRALFFLVTGLLDRLVYLSSGLALILALIGVKLVLHWAHGLDPRVPEITTAVSLIVIAVVLAITTVVSLIKSRRDPAARAHAGAVIGARPVPPQANTAAGGRRPSEGPVPDVRPEGSGQRPRRSGLLEAIEAPPPDETACGLGFLPARRPECGVQCSSRSERRRCIMLVRDRERTDSGLKQRCAEPPAWGCTAVHPGASRAFDPAGLAGVAQLPVRVSFICLKSVWKASFT